MLSLLFFLSCTVPKKIIKENNIAIVKTECGSYAVNNNGKLIGYIVKPFYVEAEKKENHIAKFENLILAKYSEYYNKFYRTYWFMINSTGDTTIHIVFLSTKQIKLIPDWECEEQPVEVYNRIYRKRNHPSFFMYNCSKSRLRISGDPD